MNEKNEINTDTNKTKKTIHSRWFGWIAGFLFRRSKYVYFTKDKLARKFMCTGELG